MYTTLTKIGRNIFYKFTMRDYIEDCYRCIDRIDLTSWTAIYIFIGASSVTSITVGVFGILKSWDPPEVYEGLFILGLLLAMILFLSLVLYIYDRLSI
jgi:hypothetical protein